MNRRALIAAVVQDEKKQKTPKQLLFHLNHGSVTIQNINILIDYCIENTIMAVTLNHSC